MRTPSPKIWLALWTVAWAAMLVAPAVCDAAADEKKTTPIAVADVKHDGPVDFEKEILPILKRNCLACHNRTDAEAELVLETPQTILAGGDSGPAIVARNSAKSLLFQGAAHRKRPIMPPKGNEAGAKNLTPEELGLVKIWIDQGAQGEVRAATAPAVWQRPPARVQPIYAAAVAPHGDFVAAGRANQIYVYHIATKKLLARLSDPALSKQAAYKDDGAAHLDLVQSLAASPDGERIASGGYRTVKIWRRATARPNKELPGVEQPPASMAVSRDRRWLALGEAGGKIRLFDLAAGKLVRSFEGHTGSVKSVCFSADALRLVSGGDDKQLRVWNVADAAQIHAIETPTAVAAVAFVTGDKQVASGGADNVIRVWNSAPVQKPPAPAEGEAAKPEPPAPEKDAAEKNAAPQKPKTIAELTGHTGPITRLMATAAGGVQLLSGSRDGTVRHWDLAGKKQIRAVTHGGPVLDVALSPDGKQIVTVSDNKVAKLWNLADGKQLAAARTSAWAKRDVDTANRAVTIAKSVRDAVKSDRDAENKRKTAEEANAKKVAETRKKADEQLAKKIEAAKKPVADKEAADKKLVETKALVPAAQEAKKKADAAKKIADEALQKAQGAVAAAKDKAAAQEAVKTAGTAGKAAGDAAVVADKKLKEAQANVKKAEADAKRLAAPAKKATDEKNAADRTLQAAVLSIKRSADAIRRATERVKIAEQVLAKKEEALKAATAAQQQAAKDVAAAEHPLQAVAFSPDGSQFAVADQTGRVSLFATAGGAIVERFTTTENVPLAGIAFLPGDLLVTAAANKKIQIWNRSAWQLERVIGSPASAELADRVTAIDFSPDGKLLATGAGEASRFGELKLWDVASGKLVRVVKDAHSDTVLGVDFSTDGAYLASSGSDRFMKVFEVATGNFVRSFEGHSHHVLGVSWRADGRMLATCGADNVVKVWNYNTGVQKKTITGFKKEVAAVAYLGTSDNFVLCSGDRSVQTKTSNGGSVRSFTGAGDFLYTVRASEDGKTIVAGGQDGKLLVWRDDGKLVATFSPPQPKSKKPAGDAQATAK